MSIEVSSFKIFFLRVSVLQHRSLIIVNIVSVLNPILGRSSRKPPDLSTRTTNKGLNVESFMTKMMQSISQSKFHVLRFEQPSLSFKIVIIITIEFLF